MRSALEKYKEQQKKKRDQRTKAFQERKQIKKPKSERVSEHKTKNLYKFKAGIYTNKPRKKIGTAVILYKIRSKGEPNNRGKKRLMLIKLYIDNKKEYKGLNLLLPFKDLYRCYKRHRKIDIYRSELKRIKAKARKDLLMHRKSSGGTKRGL